jgi:putative redox protein
VEATVRRIGGLGLAGKADTNHWVIMDTSPEGGGFGAGSSPMELLLISLGGCTAMDVLLILGKKRVKLDDFEVLLEADRAETHPRVLTAIRMIYRFYGDGLKLSDLETAVELSEEKYCSVSAMLRKAVSIECSVEIHPPRPARS